MFELLEDIEPKFQKRFKKEVSMAEITRYALKINKSVWIIVTNRKIYILAKKLWFIRPLIFSFSEIKDFKCNDETLEIILRNNNSNKFKVEFNKKEQLKKLTKELNSLIN
ncbi:hypothetical protein [Natranaerobius trueperi]|uniref:YokE-like PH domain-containing protein n=1 Tax=Natranaerobius trueperi TaxID=759412 RepID=A0A226BYA6_9FIRM|nr:hypothetical protein [Natranaerobius trueperi]OWZ83752.1 hypothetical protein CDO51_06570 [Natranaerobius trueperi]